MTAAKTRKKSDACLWVPGPPPSPGPWWVRYAIPGAAFGEDGKLEDAVAETVVCVHKDGLSAVATDGRGCFFVWAGEITHHAPVIRPEDN